MVPEKIVCFHDLHIMYLGGLQNLLQGTAASQPPRKYTAVAQTATPWAIPSNFQLLGKPRQNSTARFCNQNHVFQARSPNSRIIKPRLNGEHLSILKRNFLQTRMLMNFQSQPVTGAVKKSHSSALANFSRETPAGEKFLDRLVNRHSIHASFDSLQGQCLPSFHRFPEFSLRVARASAQNGAGHVAKISGLRAARENIQNNQ